MIYLASPYSHDDPDVKVDRFERACKQAALMMRHGLVVFSPIAHSHPISQYLGEDQGLKFWLKQDLHLLRRCEEMWVLTLDGWKISNGVNAEVELAMSMGIPIFKIDEGSVESYG